MLYLNGTYDADGYFWPVKPPTPENLDAITFTIAKSVSRYLKRPGHLYRDAESELDLVPDEECAMHGIIGASIIYLQATLACSVKPAWRLTSSLGFVWLSRAESVCSVRDFFAALGPRARR